MTMIKLHILLVTVSLTMISSCKNGQADSETKATVRTPVTVIPVGFKPVVSKIDLTATSMFLNKDIIRATTAGKIEKILIRQGDLIRSGQLLFTIRTREAAAMGRLACPN